MNEPIFKSIFGAYWNELPLVMRKHYASRAHTNDLAIAEGTLDVMCAGPVKLLAPFINILGLIPARNEQGVPVTVAFRSSMNSGSFHFNRTFHFRNGKPHAFRSRMVQINGPAIAEIMRFGITWKMLYLWDGSKIILQHRGYGLSLCGVFIPLPLTFLLGAGHAEEVAVDDDTFDMMVRITHPLWGKVYGYNGRFRITKEAEIS